MRFILALILFGVLGATLAGSIKKKSEGGHSLLDPKAEITDVKFYLYTLDNPDVPQELIPQNDEYLDASNFRANTMTKIISHGFTQSGLVGWPQDLKDEYLRQGLNYNIIIVDWEIFAEAPWYDTAAANTRPVGQWAGSLLDHLIRVRNVIEPSHVHFIGHSLGAHVAGFCGAWFGPRLAPIARITALDAAQPLFYYETEEGRLDPSDAEFVDVIHTAGGNMITIPPGLGFEEPIGHIDFYPNKGKPIQPGCGLDIGGTCSHARSTAFFIESVGSSTAFLACKCASWDEFNSGACGCPEPEYMGENTRPDHTSSGVYYLKTNRDSPYSQS